MIRPLFAAVSSARCACPVSTTARQTPIATLLTPRIQDNLYISATLAQSAPRAVSRQFTSSALRSSSPFRLSSDKNESYQNPNDEYYSPYKPKRQWPPDMSKLSPKHQFRLERKYRRRAALKYARPKFTKTVTLAQWVIIGFVVVYAVLFMNWDTKDTPFDGIRETVFSGVKSVFSSPPPPGPVKRANDGTVAGSEK